MVGLFDGLAGDRLQAVLEGKFGSKLDAATKSTEELRAEMRDLKDAVRELTREMKRKA